MSMSRYYAAQATEGVTGVVMEVVDAALTFAAKQHPAVCNRSLYEFAATLKYMAQAETSIKESDHGS